MNVHDAQTRLEDDLLHEWINGPTQIEDHGERWVNPSEGIPVGVGPGNVQPYETGATQNVRTHWVEQGWGHDSQPWPAYPFSELDNPARRRQGPRGTDRARTNFALDSFMPWETESREQFWKGQLKISSAHGAIVPVAPAVPYTEIVPTYGGGAVPHPGVDIPWHEVYP